MYRTEKFGLVSCRTENQILAELDRDLKRKRRKHLVRLCQLLGFEDLYDDKKRQEYVQKMKSKMLKQFSKEADGYFDNEDKG